MGAVRDFEREAKVLLASVGQRHPTYESRLTLVKDALADAFDQGRYAGPPDGKDDMPADDRDRVQAAQEERDMLIQQELERHASNVDAELARHARELAHIRRVFRMRLGQE